MKYKRFTVQKLSPYTIARNCTDLWDVEAGLMELKAFLDYHEKNGYKTPDEALRRWAKLRQKKLKMLDARKK
jgi:hypothetical protein